MLTIRTFPLDDSIVARRIYRDYPHQTTTVGCVIAESVQRELTSFLEEFLRFINCDENLYLRLDVFLNSGVLNVIEINIELQDGWGVALNLLRASGNKPKPFSGAVLPREIIAYSEDYIPEFELAQREFAALGHAMQVVGWRERQDVPAKSKYDDKLYLAQFSRLWRGGLVHIPSMYSVGNTVWEDLPHDVVFKFREKYGEASHTARYSVARRTQIGKGKYMRQCYNAGTAIAQEYIEPLRLDDGSATQAIILCAGVTPVTGYLQVAPQGVFVINDKTASKGALVLE